MKVNKETKLFLTTTDNPFEPVKQFDEWNAFDQEKKYFTLNLIARFIQAFEENNYEKETIEETRNFALTEIVRLFPEQYKIVECEVEERYCDLEKLKY